jgi:hypothetical protein
MTESGPSRALAPLNRDLSVERAYCRGKAEVCWELQVAVKPACRKGEPVPERWVLCFAQTVTQGMRTIYYVAPKRIRTHQERRQ